MCSATVKPDLSCYVTITVLVEQINNVMHNLGCNFSFIFLPVIVLIIPILSFLDLILQTLQRFIRTAFGTMALSSIRSSLTVPGMELTRPPH